MLKTLVKMNDINIYNTFRLTSARSTPVRSFRLLFFYNLEILIYNLPYVLNSSSKIEVIVMFTERPRIFNCYFHFWNEINVKVSKLYKISLNDISTFWLKSFFFNFYSNIVVTIPLMINIEKPVFLLIVLLNFYLND